MSPKSSRHLFRLFAVLAALVFAIGCEVDPDLDVPRAPVDPDAAVPDTGDDTGDDAGDDAGDDTGDDTGDGGDDNPPGGNACFGECDCQPHEYCAQIGTCQLRVAGYNQYCCSRLDECPAGAVCHIEGTIHETDVCPEP